MTPQERRYPCDVCGASMPLRRWLTDVLCEECAAVESLDRKVIADGIVDAARLAELKRSERKEKP